MHEQMLWSDFAFFNVAVLKAVTKTTANSNTADTTTITATAAADYATATTTTAFTTVAPPPTVTTASPPRGNKAITATTAFATSDTANTTIY